MISALEAIDPPIDYRIGFTTTGNGNVECVGTSPEGGHLRATSCTDRPDEFVWPKVSPSSPADWACFDNCPPEANEDQQPQVFDRNLPEEQKVFWSDPASDVPTSAICWNAGVRCSGGGGGIYEDCSAVDYLVDGSFAADFEADDRAVLRPVSRYTTLLGRLEDAKRQFEIDNEILVHGIVGVPNGYEGDYSDLVYQDANDPQDALNYGVGFGCEYQVDGVITSAVPPVRVRELAEAFDTHGSGARNLSSICVDDYAPALIDFVDQIARTLPAGCYEKCVADVDQSTPQRVDVDCDVVVENGVTGQVTDVPRCVGQSLPDGTQRCWVARTGRERAPGGVPMSSRCEAAGWNLEIELVRTPGTPVAPGEVMDATCTLSEFPELDCPDL